MAVGWDGAARCNRVGIPDRPTALITVNIRAHSPRIIKNACPELVEVALHPKTFVTLVTLRRRISVGSCVNQAEPRQTANSAAMQPNHPIDR